MFGFEKTDPWGVYRLTCGLLCAWLVGLIYAPSAAWGRPASGVSAETLSRVRELNDAGSAALAAKDTAAAYQAFGAAYRTQPSADGLFFLGLVALADGNRVGAEDLLRRYLSDPTLASSAEAMTRQAEAQRLLGEVGGTVESGEVSVLIDRSALVLVDERLVGQVPLSQPLLLPLGQHKIALEQGSQRFEAELTVQPGRTIEMRVNRTTGAVIVSLPPALLLLTNFTQMSPEAQQRIELSIAQAVRRERLAPLRKESTLQRFPGFVPCIKEAACQAQLAMSAEAEYALRVKIEGAVAPQPGRWRLHVELLHARVGEVAAEAESQCATCTIEQVATRSEELIEQVLGRGLGRGYGTVELTSSPLGAEVHVGDKKLGETPYKHALFAGSYALSIRKPGFLPLQESIQVEPEQVTTRALTLVPDPAAQAAQAAQQVPEPLPPRKPRPRWRFIAAAALAAAGVMLVGFGAKAVTVNDSCIDVPMAPKRECLMRYDTIGVGGALTATGTLLSVAGLTLIVVPGPRPARRSLGGQNATNQSAK